MINSDVQPINGTMEGKAQKHNKTLFIVKEVK